MADVNAINNTSNANVQIHQNTVVAEQIFLLSMNDALLKRGVIDETQRDKIKKLINKDYPISHSY